MANGIEIEGVEAFLETVRDMTISEADAKNAMAKAIEPIYDEVYANAPRRSGNLQKSIKKNVKISGGNVVGTVTPKAFYSIFQELGTSTYKGHVGFFSRSVKAKEKEAVSILARELFGKTK